MALIDFEGFDDNDNSSYGNYFTFNFLGNLTPLGEGFKGMGRATRNGRMGRTYPGGAQQTIWCNAHVKFINFTASTRWVFRDGASDQILVYPTNGDPYLTVWRGSTWLATATIPCTLNVWHFIQIRVHIHNTTGNIQIWIDGKQALNFTGNTRNTANNQTTEWRVGRDDTDQTTVRFDNIVIYNESGSAPNTRTQETQIITVFPNADDSPLEMTPDSGTTHYTRLTENPPDNDTSYVSAGSSPLTDSLAFPSAGAGGSIIAVGGIVAARKDDAGTNEIDVRVKSGSSTAGSAAIPLTTSYGRYSYATTTDPATGLAWTIGAAESAKIEVRRTV